MKFKKVYFYEFYVDFVPLNGKEVHEWIRSGYYNDVESAYNDMINNEYADECPILEAWIPDNNI